MRDVTWPRIKVRYVLEEGDKMLASAEESIADLNYLLQPAAYYANDPLHRPPHPSLSCATAWAQRASRFPHGGEGSTVASFRNT